MATQLSSPAGPSGAVASGGLTTGGAGTPAVGSDSGGFITGGSMDERNSMIVVLRPSTPALVAPIVLFLPSTVTVAKSGEPPPVVALTSPPRTLDTATFAAETLPRWPMTPEAEDSTRMAAWTAAWPTLCAWTCSHAMLNMANGASALMLVVAVLVVR